MHWGWKLAVIIIGVVLAGTIIGFCIWNGVNQPTIDGSDDDIHDIKSQVRALLRQSQSFPAYNAHNDDQLKIDGETHTHYPMFLKGANSSLTVDGGVVLNGADLISTYDSVVLLEGDVNTTYGSMRSTAFNQIVSTTPHFPNGGTIYKGDFVGPWSGGVAKGFAAFEQVEFADEINTDGLSTCPLGVGTDNVVVLFRATSTDFLSFRVGKVNTTTKKATMYTGSVTIDSTGVMGAVVTSRMYCRPLQGTTDQFVVAYNKPTDDQGVRVRAVHVTATAPALAATIGALQIINSADVSCLNVMQNTTGDYFWLAYSSSSDINVVGFTVTATTLVVAVGTEVSIGVDPNSACDIASGDTLSSGSFVVTYGGVGAGNIDAKSVIFTQTTNAVAIETPSTAFYTVTSAFAHETVRLSNTAFAVVYTSKADHKYGEIVTASVDSTTYDITFATVTKTYNRWQGDTVTPSGYDPLFTALSLPSSGITSAQYFVICFRAPTVVQSQEVCQMFHYTSGVYTNSGGVESFTLTYNNDIFAAFAGWDYFAIVAGDEVAVPGDTGMLTIATVDTSDLSIDYEFTKPSVPFGMAMADCVPGTCTALEVFVQGEWCDGTEFAGVTLQGVYYVHGDGSFSKSPHLVGDANYVPVPAVYVQRRHCVMLTPAWTLAQARASSGHTFSAR